MRVCVKAAGIRREWFLLSGKKYQRRGDYKAQHVTTDVLEKKLRHIRS